MQLQHITLAPCLASEEELHQMSYNWWLHAQSFMGLIIFVSSQILFSKSEIMLPICSSFIPTLVIS
jgi:hypothetical protein